MAGFGTGGDEWRALVLAVLNGGLWYWRCRMAGFGTDGAEWRALVLAVLNGGLWYWRC
jgi:hypothetical protein